MPSPVRTDATEWASSVSWGPRNPQVREVHVGSVEAVRVTAAQLGIGLDKEANRTLAVEAVRRASGDGASLVVLPEATMAGFGKPTTDLSALAEPLDGPFVEALSAVAAETTATVVAGTFEPVNGEARVFNTLVVVGPGGLLASYRKVHLYDALGWCESERVKAGDAGPANTPVIEVGEARVGMITCYDLRFPESSRAAVDAGATLLAVPAAWVAGPHKVVHWRTLLTARAIENTVYVVAAAQPGSSYTGHSLVADPFGEVLGELGPDDGPVALVSAEVSAQRVEEARAALPVLAHRRFAVRPGVPPGPDTV